MTDITDITDITYLRHSPYTGDKRYPSNDTNILPLRSSRYTETQMTEYVSANLRTAVSHKNRDSDSDTQPPFERGLVCTVTVTVFQSHQEYHSLEYLLIPHSRTDRSSTSRIDYSLPVTELSKIDPPYKIFSALYMTPMQ